MDGVFADVFGAGMLAGLFVFAGVAAAALVGIKQELTRIRTKLEER